VYKRQIYQICEWNRIEKIDSVARIESNRNLFARIGMLYYWHSGPVETKRNTVGTNLRRGVGRTARVDAVPADASAPLARPLPTHAAYTNRFDIGPTNNNNNNNNKQICIAP